MSDDLTQRVAARLLASATTVAQCATDQGGPAEGEEVPCALCRERMEDAAVIRDLLARLQQEQEKHDEEAYNDMADAVDMLKARLSTLLLELDTLASEMFGMRWSPAGDFVGDDGLCVKWVKRIAAMRANLGDGGPTR